MFRFIHKRLGGVDRNRRNGQRGLAPQITPREAPAWPPMRRLGLVQWLAVAPVVDPQALVVATGVQTRDAIQPVPSRSSRSSRSPMRSRNTVDASNAGNPIAAWYSNRTV